MEWNGVIEINWISWLEFILSFLLFNSGKTDAEVLPPAQVLSLIQAATENWWRSEDWFAAKNDYYNSKLTRKVYGQ